MPHINMKLLKIKGNVEFYYTVNYLAWLRNTEKGAMSLCLIE
jgi:hypothetical protein